MYLPPNVQGLMDEQTSYPNANMSDILAEGHKFQICAQLRPDIVIELLIPEIKRFLAYLICVRAKSPQCLEHDDLCQEVILYFLENNYSRLRSYDANRGSPRTWLRTLTKNRIADIVRHRNKSNRYLQWQSESNSQSPLELLLETERNRLLDAAIASLDLESRCFYKALRTSDFDARRVATQTAISTRLAALRKNRLTAKLKMKLREIYKIANIRNHR